MSTNRLPDHLRRAILLGVRARRTANVADVTGVYTARNTPTVFAPRLGSVELERAVDLLSEDEREFYRAGYSATAPVEAENVRARMAGVYARKIRNGEASEELRRWLRTTFLRKRIAVAGNTLSERLANLLVAARKEN